MRKLLSSLLAVTIISGCSISTNIEPELDQYNTFKSNKEFSNEILTEEQKEIVFKYAPVIFQKTNAVRGGKPENWDFITACDFDGDLIGKDNEENLRSGMYNLPAVLYYALTETKTHYFITYSSFHPLDWSPSTPAIPYNWHENDMENLQVVVKKQSGMDQERILILSTQAHTRTYISAENGVSSGKFKIEKTPIRRLTENLVDNGTHPGIFIESGGHGIHNMTKQDKEFSQVFPPKLKEGFTFIPSKEGFDFYEKNKTTFKYQLRPTHDLFWKAYVTNQNIGQGKLIDGSFDYKDELVNYKNLPRFFDSDRLSGPAKKDAGILPFAFSFSLTANDLGVIFFNPAKKYKDQLKIAGDWSNEYIYNPYLKK